MIGHANTRIADKDRQGQGTDPEDREHKFSGEPDTEEKELEELSQAHHPCTNKSMVQTWKKATLDEKREVNASLKGTIKRWLTGRGFGFINPEEGNEDVFVHHSEIHDAYLLEEGQKVEFEVTKTYKGLRAIDVKLVK